MNHVDQSGRAGLMKPAVMRQVVIGLLSLGLSAAGEVPVPFRVASPLSEAVELLMPDALHIAGWLGKRIDANVTHRFHQRRFVA